MNKLLIFLGLKKKPLKELYGVVTDILNNTTGSYFICNKIKYDCGFTDLQSRRLLKHFNSNRPTSDSEWAEHPSWIYGNSSAWWSSNEKEERIRFIKYLISKL